VHGSGELLQTLFKHELVDELRLWTFPLMLGTGKRLFRDGIVPEGLQLLESTPSTTGVQIALYKTGAEIRLGIAGTEANEQELERGETVGRGA